MFTFNIIFTPGTVRHLALFLLSVVENTTINVRLVSNACTPDEIELLEKFAQNNDRLELYVFPSGSDAVELHSTILNHLQKMETSDYFCFMDSDIFFTGDFVPGLRKQLETYDAVFSGTPLWSDNNKLSPDYPGAIGRFIETTDGTCLGTSYFAVYKNHILTEHMPATGIDFSLMRWDEIPEQHKNMLISHNLKKHIYDTAKLLNISLMNDGCRLCCTDIPELNHIGGLSWYNSKVKGSYRFKKHEDSGGPEVTIDDFKKAMPDLQRVLKCRKDMCEYFINYLDFLELGEAPPAVPEFDSREISLRTEAVAHSIKELVENYGSAVDRLTGNLPG